MNDTTIPNRVLALLGPTGRVQLARELDLIPDSAAEAAFTNRSEREQCDLLLKEWKRRDSELVHQQIMELADWDEDEEHEYIDWRE